MDFYYKGIWTKSEWKKWVTQDFKDTKFRIKVNGNKIFSLHSMQ
jgi:hypothetical protein